MDSSPDHQGEEDDEPVSCTPKRGVSNESDYGAVKGYETSQKYNKITIKYQSNN